MASVDSDATISKYLAIKADADAMIATATGFSRQPWQKRAGAGHCKHVDPISGVEHLHMTSGYWQNHALPTGHWRTPDFMRCERAIEPIGVLPATFSEMESFDGKLWRANGLWNYPNGNTGVSTLTTNKIFISETGAFSWGIDPTAPTFERECAAFLKTFDGQRLILTGGEHYHIGGGVNGAPIYDMPTDCWSRDVGDSGWTLRNSAMRARRSASFFPWPGVDAIIGNGRDDAAYPTVTDLNDFIALRNGGADVQHLGNAPFRGAYGRRAALFNGGVVLTGGAYSTGNGNTASTAYLDETWFTRTPLDPTSWVAMHPLPIAMTHHVVAALMIDGVETLGIINGYNSNIQTDPLGIVCTTTDLTQPWALRKDSDFWAL